MAEHVRYWDPNTNQYIVVTKKIPLPVSGDHVGGGAFNTNFPVTTDGVELKVGDSALSGRHTITIVNDSSTMIGVSIGVLLPFSDMVKLFSGNSVQISLDESTHIPFYARTPYFDTTVVMIESKGVVE